MITGTTDLLGIFGYPLEYTMSPLIHNKAIKAAGLDAIYLPLKVDIPRFPALLDGLKGTNFIGANVTMPFKERCYELCDVLSADAIEVGAVNTVCYRPDGLYGYNTDSDGFLRSLEADLGFDPTGRTACVLGAGGAAKAVVHALRKAGCTDIALVNRTRSRAETLISAMGGKNLRTISSMELATREIGSFDLVVNATPVGIESDVTGVADLITGMRPGQYFYDLVYFPQQTKLSLLAGKTGARASTGIGMLVRQAALSFTTWTGVEAPVDLMYSAALDELKNRERTG